jgi:hypothetical protein
MENVEKIEEFEEQQNQTLQLQVLQKPREKKLHKILMKMILKNQLKFLKPLLII